MQKNTNGKIGSEHGLRVLGALSVTGGRNLLERVSEPDREQRTLKVTFGVPLKGHTPPEAYHDRMLMYRHLGAREAEQFYLKESPPLHLQLLQRR